MHASDTFDFLHDFFGLLFAFFGVDLAGQRHDWPLFTTTSEPRALNVQIVWRAFAANFVVDAVVVGVFDGERAWVVGACANNCAGSCRIAAGD